MALDRAMVEKRRLVLELDRIGSDQMEMGIRFVKLETLHTWR